jgi:hypothetical protein
LVLDDDTMEAMQYKILLLSSSQQP